jgi:hypothetical protein
MERRLILDGNDLRSLHRETANDVALSRIGEKVVEPDVSKAHL